MVNLLIKQLAQNREERNETVVVGVVSGTRLWNRNNIR